MELFLAWLGTSVIALLGLSVHAQGRRAWRDHGPQQRVRILIPRQGLARAVAEARGADVVSARTAVRLGWGLMLVSPVFFPVVCGWDSINPVAVYRRATSGCRTALTEDDIERTTGWHASLGHIVDDGDHCRVRWQVDERTAIRLHLGPGGSFPAGALADRRERNARSSLPQAVHELGDDALWMTGGPTENVYATFDGLQLRLQLPTGRLEASQIESLLDRIWERRSTLEAYRR